MSEVDHFRVQIKAAEHLQEADELGVQPSGKAHVRPAVVEQENNL